MSLSVSRKNVTDAQTSGYGQEVSALHNEISAIDGLEDQDRLSSPKDSAFPKSSSSAFERWLCRGMLKTLGDPPVRLVLWDGGVIATAASLRRSLASAEKNMDTAPARQALKFPCRREGKHTSALRHRQRLL
ncbi:MAG: hypothetical protein ABSG67_13010 [Thermoguttaceae bacterium]